MISCRHPQQRSSAKGESEALADPHRQEHHAAARQAGRQQQSLVCPAGRGAHAASVGCDPCSAVSLVVMFGQRMLQGRGLHAVGAASARPEAAAYPREMRQFTQSSSLSWALPETMQLVCPPGSQVGGSCLLLWHACCAVLGVRLVQGSREDPEALCFARSKGLTVQHLACMAVIADTRTLSVL